ncbi:hypothetical protein ACWEQL_31800 [Kitasatospora sp. NPDC004240]
MIRTQRRRTRRILLIGVPVLALLLGLGGYATWNYTNLFTPDRLCDGAVATADVQKVLGPGRLTSEGSELPTDRTKAKAECTVSARRFGEDPVHLKLRTHLSSDPRGGRITPFWVHPAMSQPDRGPVGAFGNHTGWLLMPPGCKVQPGFQVSKAVSYRDADAVAVNVIRPGIDIRSDPGITASEQADPEIRSALARLTADYASAIARSSACGPTDAVDTHLSPAGQPAQKVAADQVCGIPGLRLPFPNGTESTMLQQVSAPGAPIWFCRLSTAVDAKPSLEFVASFDPRFQALMESAWLKEPPPAGWRGTGRTVTGGPVLAPCGNGNLHLEVNGTLGIPVPVEMPMEKILGAFANAKAAEHGCEPIAPR